MGEAFVAWHQTHSHPTAGVGFGPAATDAVAPSVAAAAVPASTRVVEHCTVTTCGSDTCHTKEEGIVVADVDPYLASMQL
jgi:hypothetical protein